MVYRLIASLEMVFMVVYLAVYVIAVVKGSKRLQAYNHIIAGLAILLYALSIFIDNITEFGFAGIMVGVIVMVDVLGEYIKKGY